MSFSNIQYVSLPVYTLFRTFLVGKDVAYIRTAWNNKSVTCSCVTDGFYFALCSWSVWRSVQTYETWSVLSIFSRCGPLLQDFEHVQTKIILRFIIIVKISIIVVCPMVFIFCFVIKLFRRSAQTYGDCSILSLLRRLGLFLHYFGQIKEWLIWN